MLILARHGRTDANAQRLLLGRADVALDERGAEQAQQIAACFSGRPPKRIVSSPLVRCRATAGVISDLTGTPVEVDDRWVEVDYGEYDRSPLSDVPHTVWDHWRTDITWRPPGGETLEEVGERVRRACEDAASGAVDADVLVVTHVSPIKAAVAWALGVGDAAAWRMFCDVASITRIRVGSGPPALVTYNETSHLR